jgi:hypothetical protein
MAHGANVNPEALMAFRVALIKFQENASAGLGDAESDIHNTIRWLENDQFSYWSTQIRHRQEALARANEAYRQKKLFKDSSGKMASAVEEQKQVTKCQMNLDEAMQKMAATKSWAKRLQKELMLYKGQMQRFQTTVSNDVPSAVGHLGALVHTVQEYQAMAEAGKDAAIPAELAAYFGGGGEGGMSRGTAGGARPVQPYAHLRRRTPSPPSRAVLPPMAKAPDKWAVVPLAEGSLEELKVEWIAPAATDRLIATRDASAGGEIFLERIKGAAEGDSGWYIGRIAVTDSPAEAIGVGDLVTARPDLERLLMLPVGYLVVIEQSGIVAVLNERDENVWKVAPPPEEAPKAVPEAKES